MEKMVLKGLIEINNIKNSNFWIIFKCEFALSLYTGTLRTIWKVVG
jgi:hypothetical protein